jgi:hypothetical protein
MSRATLITRIPRRDDPNPAADEPLALDVDTSCVDVVRKTTEAGWLVRNSVTALARPAPVISSSRKS